MGIVRVVSGGVMTVVVVRGSDSGGTGGGARSGARGGDSGGGASSLNCKLTKQDVQDGRKEGKGRRTGRSRWCGGLRCANQDLHYGSCLRSLIFFFPSSALLYICGLSFCLSSSSVASKTLVGLLFSCFFFRIVVDFLYSFF